MSENVHDTSEDFTRVITLKEMAQRLCMTPANLRMQIKNGTIPQRYYQKRETIILFHITYMQYYFNFKVRNGSSKHFLSRINKVC